MSSFCEIGSNVRKEINKLFKSSPELKDMLVKYLSITHVAIIVLFDFVLNKS